MKVLISGNLGYLGPLVTRKFKDMGCSTVGVDTGWYLPTFDTAAANHCTPALASASPANPPIIDSTTLSVRS